MPRTMSIPFVLMVLGITGAAGACRTVDPEIVAIEYLRASNTGESDDAVALLDMDSIVERVQDEVVLVNTEGDPDQFLRDSIETVLWGLFQESPREDDLEYDAKAAEVHGDTATVQVVMTRPDGRQRTRVVNLRKTSSGWRVSGRSIDDLVSYAIQRLEERY